MKQYGYRSYTNSLKLINKSGAIFYIDRPSSIDGFGMIYIFGTNTEFYEYMEKTKLQLNEAKIRLRADWKIMFNDCAVFYEDAGIELKGGFIQLFQSGCDFYITLGIGA